MTPNIQVRRLQYTFQAQASSSLFSYYFLTFSIFFIERLILQLIGIETNKIKAMYMWQFQLQFINS